MSKFTIEIPDELANQLEPLREHLPDLLARILKTVEQEKSTVSKEITPIPNSVYAEVLDFLLHRPTSSEIVAFKVSSRSQNSLRLLLDKNRESALTTEETAELDTYEQLEHLMILLKVQAIESIS